MTTIADAVAQATADDTRLPIDENGTAVSERRPPVAPQARASELPAPLTAELAQPVDFQIDAVHARPATPPTPTPALGPLAHFKGTFTGHGLNTIFRPDSTATPTHFPIAVGTSDNVLELNLTHETLSFSDSLGAVPNRGSSTQADAFLNGVPYLQTIKDVTTGRPIGIHFEPGMWVIVPPTADPREGSTLARMASIPHGTTINAQGTFHEHSGPPAIHEADITPFVEGNAGGPVQFPSQTASDERTHRIPQDLSAFVTQGTITQAILDDPNTVLRDAITGLDIQRTIAISISTRPRHPLFGGGTDNIAFLWGDSAAVTSPHPSGQNAQTALMTATFWIETVGRTLTIHPLAAGRREETVRPAPTGKRQPVPSFTVRPPRPLTGPTDIKVFYTQIQYTQRVILNFAGLSWPHVSVATLVPAKPVPVPTAAFA